MTARTRWACALALTLAVSAVAATGAAPNRMGLAQEAKWLTNHGAVYSTRAWAASPRLRELSRQIVVKWFERDGAYRLAWALCVVRHESGFNPGAVNGISGAAGLPQFEVEFHPGVNRFRVLHDPVYAVAQMHRVSLGGREPGPWAGGGYSCP